MLGIFKDLSNDDYHANKNAVSRSGLWDFKKTPSKYWNNYLNPDRKPKKQTPDMEFGSAFHTYVLEPELFDKQYCVKDIVLPVIQPKPLKGDLQLKHGKELGHELYEEAKRVEMTQKALRDRLLDEFAANSAGKKLLTLDQMDALRQMKQSVLNHPQAAALIVGGAIEHSLFWKDPHTGVNCKTRPDIWHENMTGDLKTVKDGDERSFISSCAHYGYHLQSAMNREGIYHNTGKDIKTHTFICVEKEWPHLTSVYILSHAALDSAHIMFKNILTDFRKCLDENIWPGYETREIELPSWAY